MQGPGPPAPTGQPAPWAGRALDAVLARVAVTADRVGDRFPLFADPVGGVWKTTARGSWAGGCWAGLLWLRARRTGAAADRAAAVAAGARLAGWVAADTAARGLILWYGTALADDPESRALRDRAARACHDAFDPDLHLVPWGAEFGGPRLTARPDAAPGTVPLLALADPHTAAAHLRTQLRLCGAGHSRTYRPGTGWTALAEPSPGWTRGHAWLRLAAADAHRLPGAAGLRALAAGLPDHPWAVPPADTARPDGPRDTSAAAITAVALLKSGRRVPAEAVLGELAARHLTADGRLLDGCYDLAGPTAVRHELVWGSFFLAFGLACLTGLAAPDEI
ncbi:sugar ABC transporter permease [Streptomyces bambusae]|nr:sugar ABC transporter permease [Streptomyces bambusae]